MRVLVIVSLLAYPVDARQGEPIKTPIQGKWTAIVYDQNGKPLPSDIVKKLKVTILPEKIEIRPHITARYKPVLKNGKREVEVIFAAAEDKTDTIAYKLIPAKGRINFSWRGATGESKTIKGLYLLEGETLKICFPSGEKNRPNKFPDQPKAGYVRMVLKRAGG
jgi:uncharacterized protein (TIGR03067 family)